MANNQINILKEKCLLHFAEAYLELNLQGQITDEQLDKITNLLENIELFPDKLFAEKLQSTFPELDLQNFESNQDD